jgi:hypothetical protein
MRDYGKVHTSFWASDTLRDLDADAKLLALYLLTSQHTHMAGVFNLPNAYASHDLGWTSERLSNGFKTLSDSGWLRRCTNWVWIVKFAKFNTPDNPNQRKAIAKQLALVPDNCSFRGELLGSSEPLFNGYVNPPIPTPIPVLVSKKKKSEAEPVGLGAWIASLNGADAVPAGDPIFGWAEKVGIPADWLALGWWAFESRYLENGKTYTDWRAVFRKALREDWLKLWRPDARSGGWVLTPAGEMAMREKSA